MPAPSRALNATSCHSHLEQLRQKFTTATSRILGEPRTASETVKKVFEFQRDVEIWNTQAQAWWKAFDDPERERAAKEQEAHKMPSDSPDRARQITIYREQQEPIQREIQKARAAPSEEGVTLLDAGDVLNDRLRELFAESSGEGIEAQAVVAFNVDKVHLLEGMAYHRRQAWWMLGLLALASAGAAAAVVYVLDVKPPPVDSHSSTVAIASFVAHIAGRFSTLAGVAWLVAFVGRLHSQHNQQSVSYRDRLAALDAAALVLHFGAPSAKEQTLLALVDAYVSQDSNAFRHRPVAEASASDQVEIALRVADPVLKRVGPILKEAKSLMNAKD